MSYDLTVFVAPAMRDHGAAWARLEARADGAAVAEIRRLADDLGGRLGDWPTVDAERATFGLGLSGREVEGALARLRDWAGPRGCVVFDPQEAVFYYADGSSSREELAPDGIHEGVEICLAELQAGPAPGELADVLGALEQFVLADSPDWEAARERALGVLDRLGAGDDGRAVACRVTAATLRAGP